LLSQVEILVSAIESLDKSALVNLANVIITIDSEMDIVITQNDTILSKVCKIDTQLDRVDSNTDVTLSKVCNIEQDLSLLPIIASDSENILCAVGSKTDFAFSDTALFTSLDGINDTEISIVSWLKTIMRELRGV